jgi:acetyl-CoA acyltransferase
VSGVVIVGAAMTPFGPAPDRSLRSLATDATGAALDDAGLAHDDVDLVVFGNAAGGLYDGQEMVRGQVALRHTALMGRPILNVENACASSSSALNVATMAVLSGQADVVLVVGAEKLVQPDRRRTYAALGGAVDLAEHAEVRAMIRGRVLRGLDVDRVPAVHSSPFMAMYAERTRAYQAACGATDADIAAVAVKNRRHGAANPLARFRTPVGVDEVLGSRMIADPLRLLMCSPVADGAAALVVTSAERAAALPVPAVRVLASVVRSGGAAGGPGAVARAAAAAYQRSGIGPDDLDVLEVHDAAASAELWCYEELGLCAAGGGAGLVAAGHVGLGGRQPVNPSGGLVAKGHPVGATGCAQLVELVDQLRGRCGPRQVPGARIGLAENGGGIIEGREATAVVTVVAAP